MSFTDPYKQRNYMGECADDAAALVTIRANHFDSTQNGSGTAMAGQFYYNTVSKWYRFYDGTTWQDMGSSGTPVGPLKESLLTSGQLDNTDGINAASVLTMVGQPVSGDTVVLSNGTVTRTYGAVAGGDIQYALGVDVAATMANLAAAIQGDGLAIWGASFSSVLESIDSDGVVLIVEDGNAGAAPVIYGTWATPANVQIVDFTGLLNYESRVLVNLPGSVPGTSNFGFRRVVASLIPSETHWNAEFNNCHTWDEDDEVWNQSSGSFSNYYTKAEMNSTTGGSEGAALVGTDTKANLGNATTVEAALTYLNTQDAPRRYSNAGPPNGVVTASKAGDLCLDTSNNVLYFATAADNAHWVL